MGKCGCGYTTDKEGMCNGTHKAVKALREDIATQIEALGLGEENNQINGVGMKILAAQIARGKNV